MQLRPKGIYNLSFLFKKLSHFVGMFLNYFLAFPFYQLFMWCVPGITIFAVVVARVATYLFEKKYISPIEKHNFACIYPCLCEVSFNVFRIFRFFIFCINMAL
jgi:hypothetical protein